MNHTEVCYALSIILENKYQSYEEARGLLDLETLTNIREILFKNFVEKCLQVKQMKTIIMKHEKIHPMTLRKTEEIQSFKIQHRKI